MVELYRLEQGWPLVFRCDALRASLSPEACAINFTRHLTLACAGCPIGAAHAGAPARTSSAAGTAAPTDTHWLPTPTAREEANGCWRRCRWPVGQVCIRCSARVFRRIGPGLCDSCLNRQAELQRGKNAKGRFPRFTASRLFKCHALLAGQFPGLRAALVNPSQCAPEVQTVAGGAFVTGIFSGRDEFERWLVEHYPHAQLLDFEQSPSFAEMLRMPGKRGMCDSSG